MDDIKAEIKETKVIDLEKEALSILASFLIGAVVLSLFLMLVFGGWMLANKNTAKNLDGKIKDVDAELASLNDLDNQILAFESAVSNIQSALNQKKKWQYVFKELNNVIPKDVVLSNFSIDDSGKLKIDGAVPSLTSLSRVLVAFSHNKEKATEANPVFRNVNLSGFSFSNGKVTFSLSAEVGGTK